MNWTDLLLAEVESTYRVTEKLIDMVKDSQLDWKPATGGNWMTTGQLLRHMAYGCGAPCRGFVTGDWGRLEGPKTDDAQEEMLPPAEALESVSSVAEAKQMLAEDKQMALDMIAQAGEEKLATDTAPAPWDPTEVLLGHRLLQMVQHLAVHKAQLFYYLKLQGEPVNTGHLWGGV